MTTPPRVPGKYGRKPRDTTRWAPTLEHYLTAELPPAPVIVDRASKVSQWPMYLNGPDPSNPPDIPDGVGDCTCATVGHEIEAWTAYASAEVTLAQADILALYEAVGGYVPGDPATDNGCEIQDVLAYWRSTGVGGHKIAAYAALGDPANLALMKQCLQTFGTVYLGINCPQSAESQFSAGEVWSVVPGSPNAGGHAIPLQRWDDAPLGDMEIVTWGSLQRMTLEFATTYIEEAWVPVSADWLTARGDTITGIDLAQLESDLSAV
jgi:hypothetical protein